MSARTNAKVLVVEDSLAVAKRLEICLQQAGFAVEMARNGRDALIMAQRRRFDLIITDEQMPMMSGRELCKHLRADDRYANTPIIFLTAAEFGKNQDDIDLRVSASFCKPFVPASVVRAAEAQLAACRATRNVAKVAPKAEPKVPVPVGSPSRSDDS